MKAIKAALAAIIMFAVIFAIAYVVSIFGLDFVYYYEGIYSSADALCYIWESADLRGACLQMAIWTAVVPAVLVFVFGLKQEQLIKPRTRTRTASSYAEIQRQKEQADKWEYQQVLREMPYQRKQLLTNSEKQLWNILKVVIPKNQYVVTKTCLKEFIKVEEYEKSAVNQRAWREIAQKHVDFLVCKKSNMYPLYAIEYDDQTHNPSNPANAATIKSDNLKDRIFDHIEMPLFRIKYEKDEDMLERQVKRVITKMNITNSSTSQTKGVKHTKQIDRNIQNNEQAAAIIRDLIEGAKCVAIVEAGTKLEDTTSALRVNSQYNIRRFADYDRVIEELEARVDKEPSHSKDGLLAEIEKVRQAKAVAEKASFFKGVADLPARQKQKERDKIS